MKQRVGIIFGGKSAEHEVSLQSAKNIYEAIDKDKFDVVLLSISKQGQWQLNQADDFLVNADNPKTIALSHRGQDIAWAPGASHPLRCANSSEVLADLDVVFPIIHGTLGEDGSLQGFLRMLDIPFVGSGVLGSAASMDKDVTKRLLRDAGLKVAPFITVTAATLPTLSAAETVAQLGLPLFVKPANQGSSVGVSKVKNQDDLLDAIKEALRFDRKVLIETGIVGREIECAVLGNDDPQTSRCGEVVLNDDFYSYETKYISDQGAKVVIPAEIDSSIEQQIRETARQAYLALDCAGMSRVDVFLTPENEIIINEINTLPGFTNISMYPKLWQATGIAYRDLITQLIEFALERGAQDKLTASAFDH